MKSVLLQLIVYDRHGQERRAILSFCPFVQLNGVLCCQVAIGPSEAIILGDEFDNSDCPLALLAADSPHYVTMVNDDFLKKFRCTRLQAIGVAFARFQGTNQSSWIPLVDAALHGKIARDKVHTSASLLPVEDDVICVPVVGALNGAIRYILVMFSPCSVPRRPIASRPHPHLQLQLSHVSPSAPTLPSRSCRDLSSILSTTTTWPALSNNPLPGNPLQIQNAQGDNAGASLEDRRFEPEWVDSPPRPDSNGPPAAIFRRLEPALSSPAAVIFTPALLGSLTGLPLPRAAATVGVSMAAFKKACRKFGIARWGYRRGASRNSSRGAGVAPEHPRPKRPLGRAKQGGAAASVDGVRSHTNDAGNV
jgi:hypothetical protein